MPWVRIESLPFAWPIIILSEGGVSLANLGPGWGLTSKRAVAAGAFRAMRIIDSNGFEHRISDCALLRQSYWRRPKTPFGRLWLIHEYLVDACEPPTFEDVRARVLRAVEANAEMWESGQSVDDLLVRLRAAANIKALIEAFSVRGVR